MNLSIYFAKNCVCCNSTDLYGSPAVMMPFVSHRALDYPPLEITSKLGLTTIKQGVAYQLCKTLECKRCGHLFLDIRFGENEMLSLYKDYRGIEYTALREMYEPGYAERNDALNNGIDYISGIEGFLSCLIPSSQLKILDWGGDTGKNTPFKTIAEFIHIYDISGKKLSIENAIAVSKDKAKTTSYDLIICSNVLEHIPAPIDVLLEIKQCMRNSTILYIEVPCEEIIASKSSRDESVCHKKKHWHEHINFFTHDSLIHLSRACGLEVLEISTLNNCVAGREGVIFQVACRLAPTIN